jgi:hypothetical protein
MSSSSVLYYPYVGLADSPWLKNALLYWEKICLIVPADVPLSSYGLPRSVVDLNRRLIAEGLVEKIPVSSDSKSVLEAGKQFVTLLEKNPRLKKILSSNSPQQSVTGKIFRQKLPTFDMGFMGQLMRQVDQDLFERTYIVNDPYGPASLLELPSVLINCYMNVLATQIAKSRKLAIGTDEEWIEAHLWTDVAGNRFEAKRKKQKVQGPGPEEANSFIVHLILQTFNVENNSIDKVMRFRKEYADERKLFRNAIQGVFSDVPHDANEAELSAYFEERWSNVVEPQLNNLRKALRGKKLDTALSLLKAAAFCTPASLFGLAQMGPFGAAIGAAVGTLPFVVETVKHSIDRQVAMRSQPLSYVLRLCDKGGDSIRHDLRLGLSIPK